ncbi:MAG: efflux RND transporter periplasmic adaptor subunit [Bacteroidota bacterium]|jgi:multidrug efflux pump subunit AcrA (membrane-fusion protein)
MINKSLSSLFPLLFTVALFGCSSKSGDSEADVKPRATVEVARAVLGSMNDVVSSTGSFQVLRDERIRSTISGKVEKVLVLEGDAVKKGEELVTILSQESNAAIAGAEQLLNQASTESDRNHAERALRLAESTAARAKIMAPFSGGIIHRFVTEGELVTQGSDLVEIVDPDTKYFLANIPLNDVSVIRKGLLAIVTIPAMDIPPLRGSVQAVNPATDPNSQSVQVRIGLNSIPALVTSGTFANVQIKVGQHNSVVLVPKPAIFHDDELNQYFVWRIQGDSLSLVTRVTIGLSDSSSFEVTSGLKPGDIVATVGGYGLPDSTQVTVSQK